MASSGDYKFLLSCLMKSAGKIDFEAVARETGYTNPHSASNRLASIKKNHAAAAAASSSASSLTASSSREVSKKVKVVKRGREGGGGGGGGGEDDDADPGDKGSKQRMMMMLQGASKPRFEATETPRVRFLPSD
ncbi:hypothetical protein L873DRAFT_1793031 [Choiromyces venosus 120613-1]|uniref:Myb-like DNA-binding domain-containing protein n=1 Tax=Choiromyces venosus 120613-1 TaxID=1336337 RepID=A0A3N4JD49_9PEZI|nr:hypothetical protein L873DRAFT_1793031 [Choiromyces venosus 120613-1]